MTRAFHLFDDTDQILTILVFHHRNRHLTHLRLVYPPLAIGNAHKTSHLEALPLLNHLDKRARLRETVVRARVEPSKSSSHPT